MRERSRKILAAIWSGCRRAGVAIWSAMRAVFGPDELGLLIALALVAGGLWWVWKPGALIVPGLVLLWLFLPVRSEFVERRSATDEKAGRKR